MNALLIETSAVFLPIVQSMDLLKSVCIAIHEEDPEKVNN